MPDVDALPPGSFCWPELATSDQKAGSAFYRGLFGWHADDQDMGPAGTYTIFKVRGRDAAAGGSLRPEQIQHRVPAHWNTYISVTNVDDAVKRAEELGGTVLAPAFDVMDAGRMAVLQDPTGAVFQAWQPKQSIGTRVQGEAGALCWTELATRDPKSATAFYTQLFGWTTKGGGDYTELAIGTSHIGGIMPMPNEVPADVPSHWMPYFMVDDVDASVRTAAGLGGAVRMPATDIADAGRFAVIADPQGATFAVFTPKRR
jgi:predicted enzyme related to lactoylglutathione lyase